MPFIARTPFFRLSLVALAASTSLAAVAQSSDAPQEEPKDSSKLEAVVVTATKRIQPLQKTPLAVSVIGGGALEELNLNNLSTITAQLPTVNYRSNASNKDSALFIRGVGTISTSPGVEPTVSMVLDGVVTARPGQATLDLVEVDRIEILRGPQGTLFGKNASAGVINIVTRSAAKGKGGYLDLSAYQGGEHRVRAGVFGGTSELRGSLSMMTAKFDGNVTNVADGSKVNGYDRDGVRARVEVQPSKDLKFTVIGDYTRAYDTTPTGVPYSTNVTAFPSNVTTANPLYAAAVAPVVPSPTNRQINSEMLTRVRDTNQGLSAQIDYNLPDFTLTSITAHRGWKNHQFQDQDRLSKPYRQFAQQADEGKLDFTQFTQELRVASNGKQTFEYVAGLFYFDGKNDEVYRRDVIACPTSTAAPIPPGLIPCDAASTITGNGVATYGVRSKSKALFGEGTMNFSPELRSIFGLRYTQDSLSYYHGRVASATGLPGVGATRATVKGGTDVEAISGRIGPQFDFTRDIMGYATYSRGYKGPAFNVFFNMSPTQDNVLAPEKSKSYELGLKSELLDRRLRVNLAVFDTEYSGYQANVQDLVNGSIVTRLINAGKVQTKGAELDITARPMADLTLNFSVANIKARVKDFLCPVGATASCFVNGLPLPFSPDWKASLRAKYNQSINDDISLDYGFDVTWQTKTQFDLQQQPNSFQPAYTIYNARVALQHRDGWVLALIGRNLGDKSYATLVQASGTNINRYVPRDDRRYFGVNLRYDF
jgi:iron complex outermembrane recepter protein